MCRVPGSAGWETRTPAQPSGPFTQTLEWRWFTGEPGDPKWSRDFTESSSFLLPVTGAPTRGSSCAGGASMHSTFLPLHSTRGRAGTRGKQWPLTPSQWNGPSVLSCAPGQLASCSVSCPAFCSVLPGGESALPCCHLADSQHPPPPPSCLDAAKTHFESETRSPGELVTG